jgi:hypothetical protein
VDNLKKPDKLVAWALDNVINNQESNVDLKKEAVWIY